jgi:NADH-quinone oxidoreductase subunit J
MDALVFHAAALLSVILAALVVTRKNPVYGAIYLIAFFLLVSVQFLVLRAPFLATVQVFIYAGAIMVLFVFVIMLLNLRPEELREGVPWTRRLVAGTASAGLFALLASAIHRSKFISAPPEANLVNPEVPPAVAAAGDIDAVGRSLFGSHIFVFEFSSILILTAIVAAIYLTKKRKRAPPGIPVGAGPPAPTQAGAGTAGEVTA